ncbi:MAG: hypothetical protein OXM61_07130 [Candidatus Poribacteria bacterium]|nr:hypothetical protein [Candidatus Poribacteria bacterium]
MRLTVGISGTFSGIIGSLPLPLESISGLYFRRIAADFQRTLKHLGVRFSGFASGLDLRSSKKLESESK